MTKLNDIQLVLLTTAAARDDGNLLPPPDTLADLAARVRRAIVSLLKQALVAEVETGDRDPVWREEDGKRFMAVITDAGRSAIGVPVVPQPEVQMPVTTSKIETVLTMLRRPDGTTLDTLVAATGWLPHTTRAALTRLRQKGHAIERAKRDGATVYSIKAVA